jgi:TPR repeat protein
VKNKSWNSTIYGGVPCRQGEAEAYDAISDWVSCGVPGCLEPNEKLGFRYALLAANGGWVPAYCQVGYLYERGIGVARDPQKAKDFYLRGAARKDKVAQMRLDALISNFRI